MLCLCVRLLCGRELSQKRTPSQAPMLASRSELGRDASGMWVKVGGVWWEFVGLGWNLGPCRRRRWEACWAVGKFHHSPLCQGLQALVSGRARHMARDKTPERTFRSSEAISHPVIIGAELMVRDCRL
jgi:hypothetical protein